MAVEPSQGNRGDEKENAEPCRDFCEHIPGTGSEQGIRDSASERSSEAFAAWTLHQHNQDEQEANDDMSD
jgi:hypothetical protein